MVGHRASVLQTNHLLKFLGSFSPFPVSRLVDIGKSPDLKKLEPVKYTDEGDYYTVHRVLSSSEQLYLRLGDDTSEIRRK